MPSGLKKVGATYQRMINKVFKDLIRRNLEVYVNNIFIKSQSLNDHLVDLKENFIVMKTYKGRINPAKCVLGNYWQVLRVYAN